MYIFGFINQMLKFIFFKQPIGVSNGSKWYRVTVRWSFAISAFSIRRSTQASKRSSNSANPDTALKWRTIFYTGATLLKEPPGWLSSLKQIWMQVVKLLMQFLELSAARKREDLIHIQKSTKSICKVNKLWSQLLSLFPTHVR